MTISFAMYEQVKAENLKLKRHLAIWRFCFYLIFLVSLARELQWFSLAASVPSNLPAASSLRVSMF